MKLERVARSITDSATDFQCWFTRRQARIGGTVVEDASPLYPTKLLKTNSNTCNQQQEHKFLLLLKHPTSTPVIFWKIVNELVKETGE